MLVATELSVRGTTELCVWIMRISFRVAANYSKRSFWEPWVTPTPLGKKTFFFQLGTELHQLSVGSRKTIGTGVSQNSSFGSRMHCALEKVPLPANTSSTFSLPPSSWAQVRLYLAVAWKAMTVWNRAFLHLKIWELKQRVKIKFLLHTKSKQGGKKGISTTGLLFGIMLGDCWFYYFIARIDVNRPQGAWDSILL